VKQLFTEAAKAFLLAAGAVALTYGEGIFEAPNLAAALALAVAMVAASFAGGIAALQAFVPRLSFGAYIPQPWGAFADRFLQTAVATLIVAFTDILNAAPDLHIEKAAIIAAITGAIAAGFRSIVGLGTKGEFPLRKVGFEV
jgi:hypothetical protein